MKMKLTIGNEIQMIGVFIFLAFDLFGQSLGRVTFSSGTNSSTNLMPCSFGEVFIGNASNAFTMGSQQSFDINTSTIYVKKQVNNRVSVFPNPVKANLTIVVDDEFGLPYNIHVINLEGKSILEARAFQTTYLLEVRDIHPGMYSIQVSSDKGHFIDSKTFIKL